MSRIFFYCRDSVVDRKAESQFDQIAEAGYDLIPENIVTEIVSGSEAAIDRSGFKMLINQLEAGDVLVVARLDCIGRNAMDVSATVKAMSSIGVSVHCLAIGREDLTSPAGKKTMEVIAAVANFERDLLVERTQAGLERVKAKGKQLGRPPALDLDKQKKAIDSLRAGASISEVARTLKTSRATVMRTWQSANSEQIQANKATATINLQ